MSVVPFVKVSPDPTGVTVRFTVTVWGDPVTPGAVTVMVPG